MIDSQNSDMQIYDIYDVIYTPWWQKGWFIGILGLLCIFLCFLCFFAYRKYKRRKPILVDFFIAAQKELALYKEMLEKNPENIDTHKIYNALIVIFKEAYLRYEHVDFFNKTGSDLQEALKSQGVHDEQLYDFLDAAQNARFSNQGFQDLLLPHIEYIQGFLIKIVQNKAKKPK